MTEHEELIERSLAVLPKLIGTLPVCPFDRRSPDYWTTPNDKPCHVCGGTEAVDKCRGADLRCMDEASDIIREAAVALHSLKEEVERLRGALERIKHLASDFDSPVMAAWDRARAELLDGDRGSLPRDIMESGLSEIWTLADTALSSPTASEKEG